MSGKLSTRTAKASAWLLTAVIASKGVDFVLLVLLARILTPQDFALIALAMIFVQITEAVLEMPISQALIRVPEMNRSMLDTAFTLSFLRALVIAIVLGALAPAAAAIFDDQRLTPLVMVAALGPAFRGMVSPRMAEFFRQLDYRQEAVVLASGKFVAFFVALAVALTTRSYWALAVGSVSTPVVMTIVSYIYAPFWPRLTVKSWSTFSNAVGWHTVSQIFRATNWQINIFVLGQSVPAAVLGRYSIATQLATAPYQLIGLPAGRPLMAAYSTLRSFEDMRRAHKKASVALFALCAPILVAISLLAAPIIAILFDDKWTPAAAYLQYLALIAAITIPIDPVSGVALVFNRNQLIALRSFIELAIKLPFLLIGAMMYGVYGVIGAAAIGRVTSAICGLLIGKSLLTMPLTEQILAHSRTLIGCACLAIVVGALRPLIPYDDTLMLVLATGGVAALGLLAYVGSVFALWHAAKRPDGMERWAYDLIVQHVERLAAIARLR